MYIIHKFDLARYIMLPIDIKYNLSFSYILLSIELFIIYLGIDRRMNEKLAEKEVELANHQLELEKKNAQIMVSQIQPHFLYNTLSVIDYLCGQNVELARTAINHFSEYLRTKM